MKYTRNSRKRKFKKRKKSRKSLADKLIQWLVGIAVTAIVSGIGYVKCCATSHDKEVEGGTPKREFVTDSVTFNGKYSKTFNDLQDVQIVAAEKFGVVPLSTADSIDLYVSQGLLVEVPTCAEYETEECSHPYLTPDAKALLEEISRRYHQKETGQLRVTGCLRTDQSVAKLRRGNRNSVKNSCHLYGTTFDVSYRYLEAPQKRWLAQVLYELQQAGYCYVKYEYKQPCFHITVRL